MVGVSRYHLWVCRGRWCCAFFGSNWDLSYTRRRSGVWEQLDLNQCCDSTCHVDFLSLVYFLVYFFCSFETGLRSVILGDLELPIQTKLALTSASVSTSCWDCRNEAPFSWSYPKFNFNDRGDMGILLCYPGWAWIPGPSYPLILASLVADYYRSAPLSSVVGFGLKIWIVGLESGSVIKSTSWSSKAPGWNSSTCLMAHSSELQPLGYDVLFWHLWRLHLYGAQHACKQIIHTHNK